ncbi:unnamed protein product [Acanthosepion pharaonis]|uniref:Uncharacterized protein n=1 Tax=Acanthosepion pharaonis TaxID=158019 RepID=A0A812CV12_ACAPH|nr:unnamed protein product [Sepia pharaonis]
MSLILPFLSFPIFLISSFPLEEFSYFHMHFTVYYFSFIVPILPFSIAHFLLYLRRIFFLSYALSSFSSLFPSFYYFEEFPFSHMHFPVFHLSVPHFTILVFFHNSFFYFPLKEFSFSHMHFTVFHVSLILPTLPFSITHFLLYHRRIFFLSYALSCFSSLCPSFYYFEEFSFFHIHFPVFHVSLILPTLPFSITHFLLYLRRIFFLSYALSSFSSLCPSFYYFGLFLHFSFFLSYTLFSFPLLFLSLSLSLNNSFFKIHLSFFLSFYSIFPFFNDSFFPFPIISFFHNLLYTFSPFSIIHFSLISQFSLFFSTESLSPHHIFIASPSLSIIISQFFLPVSLFIISLSLFNNYFTILSLFLFFITSLSLSLIIISQLSFFLLDFQFKVFLFLDWLPPLRKT